MAINDINTMQGTELQQQPSSDEDVAVLCAIIPTQNEMFSFNIKINISISCRCCVVFVFMRRIQVI